MSFIKKKLFIVLSLGLLFVSLFSMVATVPTFANAGIGTPAATARIPKAETLCNGPCPIIATPPETADRNTFATFILNIARFLTFIAGAVAVLFFVYGGVLYITDDGSGAGAEKGKKILINAVIGLVVVIISYTVIALVSTLVNGDLFGTGTGTPPASTIG